MKNLPILGKLLAILAVFGAFAGGCALYATSEMRHIQGGYARSANGPAAYALLVSRSNGSLSTMRAAVAALVIARTETEKNTAWSRFMGGRGRLEEWTRAAAKIGDSEAVESQSLANRVNGVFDSNCSNTIELGRTAATPSDVIAAQDAFRSECAGPLEPLADIFLKRIAAAAAS